MFEDMLGREAAAAGTRAGAARAVDQCNFKAKGSGLCGVLKVLHGALYSLLNWLPNKAGRFVYLAATSY